MLDRAEPPEVTDREVVEASVANLHRHVHPDLEISCRPDENNGKMPDIDAIAASVAWAYVGWR